ncbi:alpha-2-macroglobulin family protein [Faecalibacter bovis]|uniref:TonB-dependent receptor plug domain-containing protein n=1 Tax=Faecalibacter bovis TaxID=2898187 RepID=A0ABX7X9T6_9FLAO|nr:MG2 domain-containing protein [Faecalibacter bovis]QTV04648.1 TonB-dependent receptor plug domain-containing protein [Faecalibacter bovis]
MKFKALFFLILSFYTFGQNFDYKSNFDSINSNIAKKNYDNANRFIQQTKSIALKENKQPEYLLAFFREIHLLRFKQTNQEFFINKVSETLNNEIKKANKIEKAILHQYYANFLFDRIYSKPIKENDQSNSYTDWSTVKKIKYIDSLLVESIKDYKTLQKEPSEKWKLLFTSNAIDQPQLEDVKTSFAHYNSFTIAPTLFHILGNMYLNGIDNLYSNNINDVEKRNQIINHRITTIQNELEIINQKSPEAKAYQYYTNFGRKRDELNFDDLIQNLKKIPADFNAQILYRTINNINYTYNYNRDKIPTAIKQLNQAIELYPNTIWTKNLIELKKKISKPSFNLDFPTSYTKNEYIPITITSVKTDQLYIRIYKNSHPFDKKQVNFSYDTIANRYETDAKLVYEEKIKLKHFEDYLDHSTLYKINPLEAGEYFIVASNHPDFVNDDETKIVKSSTITISDWIVKMFEIDETNNGYKYKAQIINRNTGLPLLNTRIQLYNDGEKKDYDKIKSLTTNEAGEFFYQSNDNSDKYEDLDYLYLYIPSSKEFIELMNLDVDNYNYNLENNASKIKNAVILTDRAIYRPNQEVFFKAIVYEKNQKTGNVLAGIELKSILFDANHQKIDSIILKTNEFGSINGKFKLPEETLNGNFRISVFHKKENIGYQYFQVEEYKRPTFRVKLNQPKENYQLGDTAIFKGFVESLSGARLTNVKIEYEIKSSLSNINFTDHTTTDENGEFTITQKLVGNQKYNDLNFYIKAINETGESQITSLKYYFSENPYQINLAPSKYYINKDWKDININTENLNKQFTPLKGQITIYQIPEPAGIYGEHEYDFDSDYHILSSEAKHKYFGKYNLNDENLEEEKRYWKNYKIVQTSSFDTNEKKFVTVNQPEKLSKGKYLVEAISIIKNDTISDFKVVHIAEDESYRTSSKEFLTVKFSKNDYNVGDEFKLEFETDFKEKSNIFLYLQEENKFIKTIALPFKNGKAIYTTKITKELVNNNFKIDYLFIKNNQYKSGNLKIPMQVATKELEIKTAVFRDKIQPGNQETWSLKIVNPNQKNADAEVLASMYDASLDQFRNHSFYKINWNRWAQYPFQVNNFMTDLYDTSNLISKYKSKSYIPLQFNYPEFKWVTYEPFQEFGTNYDVVKQSISVGANTKYEENFETSVDQMLSGKVPGIDLSEVVGMGYAVGATNSVTIRGVSSITAKNPLIVVDGVIQEDTFDVSKLNITSTTLLKDQSATALYGSRGANGVIVITTDGKANYKIDLSTVKTRTNLQETAFFYPTLRTDKAGLITFEFTSPEALSEWKLLVFAHDKELNSGVGTFTTKTQKDLMVSPHLPRFLRSGDEMVISAQIQNISENDISGLAKIELINPQTNEVINNLFNIVNNKKTFDTKSKQNSLIEWSIKVPDNLEDVIIKIVVGNNQFSDGEQQVLPILPNKIEISEANSFVVLPNEEKEITINNQKNNFKQIKIDIESNQLVQVLSILNNLAFYPYECTEQTTSKWYAYKLLEQIKATHPEVVTYLQELLKTEKIETSFDNEINKIKSNWVNKANSQKEQLIQIAKLFEGKNISKEIKSLESKIVSSQLKDGSFPWFEGGKTNHEITKQILIYMGRMIKSQPNEVSDGLKNSFQKGVEYLIQYNLDLQKSTEKIKNINLSNYIDLIYIYQFNPIENPKIAEVKKLYQKQYNNIETEVAKSNLSLRAKAAIVTKFLGSEVYAKNILKSLDDEMIVEKENGSYWNDPQHYFLETPLSTQAVLVEAFLANGKETQNLVQWMLLKHKQNAWNNTLSNNYTVSSLLNTLKSDQKTEPKVEIKGLENLETTKVFGQEILQSKNINQIPDSFKVKNNQTFNLYGTVITTHQVPFEDVKSHQSKLRIEREILIKEKEVWVPLNRDIRLGENLKIKLTLISEEDVSYIHLKDNRAAGFEPVYKPSGYKWIGGTPHYFETKDTETNFFIDYLPKGFHVFEYEVKANNLGTYNAGISQAESMYNTSYKTHSKSSKITIVK